MQAKSRRWSRQLALFSLLLIWLITLTALPAAALDKGAKAPDFTLMDTVGNTVSLSQMQGKVVVINFFTIWCMPCREEMPDLNAIYNENKGKGLAMVGICLNVDPNQLRFFVKQMKLDYPILVGTEKVNKDYGEIVGVPTTFIINRQGEVVAKVVGAHNKAYFMNLIQPLL